MIYKDFNSNLVDNDYDQKAINNAINNILSTTKGTLPSRPDFGCNLKQFIFEPLDNLLISNMKEDIHNSLSILEPRITIKRIDVSSQPEFNRAVIQIDYTLNKDLEQNVVSTKYILNQSLF